jgi:hypothetical protein
VVFQGVAQNFPVIGIVIYNQDIHGFTSHFVEPLPAIACDG